MLELAVASREETFERMRESLAARDVRARYVRPSGRTFAIVEEGRRPGEFRGFDVGFVYPPRLMEGGVVDALLSVPWVNGPGAVLTSRNKGGVLASLAAADVPVPETVVVSNPVEEADLVAAFDRFDPPVVVKPNSTTRGVGVTKAHDLDSFLGIADYLALVHDFRATRDRSFLVQEHLPNVRDYRVMVVAGEHAGAVERRVPTETGWGDESEGWSGEGGAAGGQAGRWKHNVHRNAVATAVDLPDDLVELAERAARVLDIDFLGVDLLVSGDRAVVSETNARPTIDEAGKYEPDFYDRLASVIRSRVE